MCHNMLHIKHTQMMTYNHSLASLDTMYENMFVNTFPTNSQFTIPVCREHHHFQLVQEDQNHPTGYINEIVNTLTRW